MVFIGMHIIINSEENKMKYIESNECVLKHLAERNDAKAQRIKKMLGMPDLSRDSNSPVYYTIEAIKKIELLNGHDLVEFPEIVPADKNFDLLGTPKDHPSRSQGDTFYLDENHVLRTQTTTMWPYYLRDKSIQHRLYTIGQVLAISYGKVYRNDEIDRGHYPVFHQVDGLCVCKNESKLYSIEDLVTVLVSIAKSVYGSKVQWRVEDDTFPFTEPSIELQIECENEWLEVLGAGLVNKNVLEILGIDSTKYNGWAFGFGLDRLAMIKMGIPDIRIFWSEDERIRNQFKNIDSTYTEVSKYPPTDRDISFIVRKGLSLNLIYELMRDCGYYNNEDVIEEVKLVDTYTSDDNFGKENVSYTFRIRYRSFVRSLTNAEINEVQERMRNKVSEEFNAKLR